MAMGGIALALGTFPYAPRVFRRIALVPWLGNCLLLSALYLGFAWRMFTPSRRLYDRNEPLFYGFGATALSSIASTTALLGDEILARETAARLALVIWWCAVCISVAQTLWVCIYLVEKALEATPVKFSLPWLGIFTGVIVSSSSGGLVATRLSEDPRATVAVLFTSLALLGVSFPVQIGLVFTSAYCLTTGRLALEFASYFMLLGPTAVSGNALINIGAHLHSLRDHFLLRQRSSVAALANISGGLGLFTAFLCWSVTAWLCLCVIYTAVRWRSLHRTEYDARLWAFIFSTCIFAVLTTNIWVHTGFVVFRVMGAVLQIVCFLLYAAVCVALGCNVLMKCMHFAK